MTGGGVMADYLDVSEIIRDRGYPGFTPDLLDGPRMFRRARHLTEADLSEFWIMDFRFSYGARPLGFVMMDDGLAWPMQSTAYSSHVPGSNGQDIGMAGIHCYIAEVPQFNADEDLEREAQLEASLPDFVEGFEANYAAAMQFIEARAQRLERFETAGKSLDDLADYLEAARLHLRRSFEVHFSLMYSLLLNHFGFCALCEDLGIAVSEVPKFLLGRPSKITEGDKALFALASEVKDGPLTALFADKTPGDLHATLQADNTAAPFLRRFDAFLDQWGWRTDDVGNPEQAPWVKDPAKPLEIIQTLAAKETIPDIDQELAASVEQREVALDAARSKLSASEQGLFDEAVTSLQKANFVWWNEDHNFYIDMRCSIPLHNAAMAIGAALDLSDPADTCYLFYPELERVARGEAAIGDYAALIQDRRDYFEYWHELRGRMPKYLGEPPEVVADPIMIEMDGVTEDFLATLRTGGADATVLKGMPGAPGKVHGRARVMLEAGEIATLQAGDILVCEGTSPSWTPAFGKIAGCAADVGGSLSHTAVVSREYGVPSVLGLAVATKTIRDGDLIEVDGDAGRVTILERGGR